MLEQTLSAGGEEPAEPPEPPEPPAPSADRQLIAGGLVGLAVALLAVLALKLGAGPPTAPVRSAARALFSTSVLPPLPTDIRCHRCRLTGALRRCSRRHRQTARRFMPR